MRRKHRAENPSPKFIKQLKPPRKKREYRHKKLYNSATWQRLRRRQLNERPICALCGMPASQVDHIRRHEGDIELFEDETNLQSLCRPCHDRKTAAERRGWKPD